LLSKLQSLCFIFQVYDIKLSELKKLTADLYQRVYEAEERPKAIEALNGVVNYTEYFRDGMKNLTGEDQPFTEVELATLEKLINTTKVCPICNGSSFLYSLL